MWIVLALLCTGTAFRFAETKHAVYISPFEGTPFEESDQATLENEDSQVRLPRRFPEDQARIERLHIQNQTGFDGKVRRIRFDIDDTEERPGIRAYGLPKKRLGNNGYIRRISLTDDGSRSGRLIQAYGLPKERLETNGYIERMGGLDVMKDNTPRSIPSRMTRSIPSEPKNEDVDQGGAGSEDLDAGESKVFRPLFVYRQQMAARQRRNQARNSIQNTHQHGKSCNHGRVY
ncbi:hypothetical protein KM043_017487 [Ampulex compressa]|nr:hypothetical protein KM043_017487 [Ampulex compressa]